MKGSKEEPETRYVDVDTARTARVSLVTMILTVSFIIGYTGWLMFQSSCGGRRAARGLPFHARTSRAQVIQGSR